MQSLPESGAAEEAANPWNVREVILHTGYTSALGPERWEDALDLSREVEEVTKARGATDLEVARTRFNDCGPLLRLGRYLEASQLLLECRQRFEEASYTRGLGAVLSALADLEDKLGHRAESVRHEQASLRFKYHVGEPRHCAISHFNLANYLMDGGGDPQEAFGHRLAAAAIRFQTGDGHLATTLQALSQDLESFSPGPPPLPANFDELCEIVERVEGVRFRDLFSRLPTENSSTGDEAFRKVLELARSEDVEANEAPEELRPLIEALRAAAAAGEDTEELLAVAREQFLSALGQGQEDKVGAVIAVIRRALEKPTPP
jgi:hypothetical protein